MKFDEDVILKENDGEAEEFKLMTLEEVKDALARGEFKLNCAMTWMAFLIRHGHVTAENEENLIEICARMHSFCTIVLRSLRKYVKARESYISRETP